MRFAIVINLDYDTNPEEICRRLWIEIRDAMMDAGFRLEGRLFTIEESEEVACDLARDIIERLNGSDFMVDQDIYNFLKEFYGYDHSRTVNLLLPPTTEIRLDEA